MQGRLILDPPKYPEALAPGESMEGTPLSCAFFLNSSDCPAIIGLPANTLNFSLFFSFSKYCCLWGSPLIRSMKLLSSKSSLFTYEPALCINLNLTQRAPHTAPISLFLLTSHLTASTCQASSAKIPPPEATSKRTCTLLISSHSGWSSPTRSLYLE